MATTRQSQETEAPREWCQNHELVSVRVPSLKIRSQACEQWLSTLLVWVLLLVGVSTCLAYSNKLLRLPGIQNALDAIKMVISLSTAVGSSYGLTLAIGGK